MDSKWTSSPQLRDQARVEAAQLRHLAQTVDSAAGITMSYLDALGHPRIAAIIKALGGTVAGVPQVFLELDKILLGKAPEPCGTCNGSGLGEPHDDGLHPCPDCNPNGPVI